MSKIDEKKIKDLIHSIGLKYQLSDDIIKQLVESPYLFTKETILNLEIEDIETEDELDKLKTNFYYKSWGRLFIPFNRVDRRNKQRDSATNINKRRWKK